MGLIDFLRTYFCPTCGKSLESSGCIWPKGWRSVHVLCPVCQKPVWLSGTYLMVLGMLWVFFWSLVLCEEAGIIGIIGGVCFVAIGVWRLIRQFIAARRTKR